MAIEEIRGGNDETDRFPIGMRVLAVDDDPLCLKLLDALLRKCQYEVTTTKQARIALEMLRENRNRFDLIISDVYMPDMDGFKLLELVGLEMDLPVIMLSGNSDPKLVMKGIQHGACDYLVKPVRLEELRNIWQHVVRRKVESKSHSKSNNNEKSNQSGQEVGSGDQNARLSRKRKDEEEDDENGQESDDPAAQKKPRVVWSIDLHRKFVAAVNQLGIDKAVPKRILDLMNVEGLTRENVASHLQKYRLYLKRISHQTNMVMAFGGSKDASSYLRMGSLDGLGDFHGLQTSRNLVNSSNSSYSPSGMLGRLRPTTGMTLHGLTSPSLIQPSHPQNNQFQPVVLQPPPNHNLYRGMSPSFDLDQIQQGHKQNPQLSDFNSVDQLQILTSSGPFTENPNLNQSSLKLTSTGVDSFNLMPASSRFLDQNSIQLSKFSSNPLPVTDNSMKYGFVNGGFGANIPATAGAANVSLEPQTGGFVSDVRPSLLSQNQIPGQFSSGFSSLASSGLSIGTKEVISGVYNGPNEAEKSSFVPASNGYDSLDDIMNGMMKREQDPAGMAMDGGEFGFDPYPFGSCI